MNRFIVKHLKKLPFFSVINAEEILFLSDFIEEKIFEKGEIILPQGSRGGDLYLIISGLVSVNIILPGDYKKELTTLGEGQVFGEVTFLTDALVTASVVAYESCSCLIINHKILDMLRLAKPDIAFKIEEAIVSQTAEKISFNINSILDLLRQIPSAMQVPSLHALYLENASAKAENMALSNLNFNYLKKLNYFSELTDGQIEELLPFITVKNYEKGYRFLSNKANSKKIALIYEGAVMFFIKEKNQLKKSLAVLGINTLFLQNFIFPEFRQVADYVACANSTVIELDRKLYLALHYSNPALFYTISRWIHRAIAESVYVINRQFLRITSEYKNLISEG